MLAIAAPVFASGFSSFDQRITVNRDSTLTVQEVINVDFPDRRHGIFRDIPVRYVTAAGNPFNLRVRVISVTDENGNPLTYKVSRVNDMDEVKIGDADLYVYGSTTYVITYTVSRSLLFMNDHDELYWNVITQPWGDLGMPGEISASVVLPGQIKAADIQLKCFTALGSTSDGDCTKSAKDGAVRFGVEGGKPLTVVVGWPKGAVAPPAALASLKEWLADNGIVFWPIIVFAGMFLLWYKKGRDPKPDGAIVVQYEPPEGASPAEVGVLFDQKAAEQEITATVVHLAVKGYLNIVESEKNGLLGSTRSYSFELKKDFSSDATLADYEREMLNGIFGQSAVSGSVVDLDQLKNEFYKTAAVMKKEMDAATVRRGWFAKSPAAVRGIYMGAGFGYLMLIFFFLKSEINGMTALVSAVLPGVFVLFFGYFMPARSLAGTKAYANALGFKEYLGKAEAHRLKWQEKENIFQEFLPYAMVFGVVDKWAKAFEGMNMQPPSWYHGGTMNGFTPVLFAHTLTDATSSIGKSLAVAPSSHGGSGGGFGGGGFGGGGFGGGGGGSW